MAALLQDIPTVLQLCNSLDHDFIHFCVYFHVFPCISMYFLFAGTEKNVAG